MGRPWDDRHNQILQIYPGLTRLSETDIWHWISVAGTATGLPVRWIGGISNHAVDTTAAHVHNHRKIRSIAHLVCSLQGQQPRNDVIQTRSSACLFINRVSRCDGLCASVYASKEGEGQWTADWKQRARLTWLLTVLRIASPTYRSTIDNDQSSKRFAGPAATCEVCAALQFRISPCVQQQGQTRTKEAALVCLVSISRITMVAMLALTGRPLPVAMTKSSACGCCTSSTSTW